MIKLLKEHYPLKVWAFTLFFGPLFGIWLNFFRWHNNVEFGWLIGGPFALTIVGIFCSLPAFALYYLSFYWLSKNEHPVLLIKVVLSLLAVLVVIGTIYFFVSEEMLQSTNRDGFLLLGSYVFCAFFSTIFFTIKKAQPAS